MVAKQEQVLDGPVGEAVRRLVDVLHPERSYLFGSQARGDATQDSDYDFMVIVPESEESISERRRQAYRALWDVEIANDVFVRTRAQFDRDLPVIASFAATIEREGRVLYDRPSSRQGIIQHVDQEQRKAELTRDWVAKAQPDLVAAERAEQSPAMPDIMSFITNKPLRKL